MYNITKIVTETIERLSEQDYCVIKLADSFPNLNTGSDIDVFCRNVSEVCSLVRQNMSKYLTEDSLINVQRSNYGAKIDLVCKAEIVLRFDLYGCFPRYKKVNIKNSLFDVILERAECIIVDGCSVKVPNRVDECILRYIEFQEYYSERPAKIRHLEYIIEFLKLDGHSESKFYQRLYYFTALSDYVEETQSAGYLIILKSILNKTVKSIRKNGFFSTLKLIRSVIANALR